MEMSEDVEREIYEAEGLIKEIYARNIENARKEAEPLVKMICSIRAMHPKPLIVPMEQLIGLGILKDY